MGTATFPIDEAYLIGDWLESFVWGVYTTIFSMTLYTIYQKRHEGVNKFTTITIIVLYILATAHIALALTRLIQGFVIYRNEIDPVFYFANISLRVNMAKDYLYITTLFLGDIVIVWRLYVVWGKNVYVAIIPALMCLGELADGWASISQWLAPTQNFTAMANLGTAMYSLSLGTNIILTLVIVARIWLVSRRTRQALGVESGSYQRVLLLLIESGALIAAAKVVEFVLYQIEPDDGLSGINAIEIVYECMPQITGLAPTCIIFAVNKGYTHKDEYYSKGKKSSLAFNAPTSAGETSQTDTTMFVMESGGAVVEKPGMNRLHSDSSSGSMV
ncbi:hypothetical protein C8Q77DRAFT_1062802 [Trametes polyzona]|nr:hypothetical protein C8Q77DRAFT_1062802 [Trametes polyzona]